MTTISGLMPSTIYTIEVAAVNSAGTGVYSTVIMGGTADSGKYYDDGKIIIIAIIL